MELSDPKIGTSVEGRYRLQERLAAGGMGVVYRGEQIGIGKTVAVKFLHEAFTGLPDLVKRFQREVAAMSRLAHPNLVSIIDSGVSLGVPFLVMDFHSGKPLADVLERGALPPARAVGIARQVLAGVAHAHASGVVHRDLKPDNILLIGGVDGDFVKILDFGLAKMVHGSSEGATQLTNTGFALGTPGYMAPEQAKGAHTDERADIYAVGVILYQMVVGRKPFIADSPMAVLRMHMEEPPLPPRKAAPDQRISSDLESVILRALEKLPAKRWKTAEAFARALEATSEGGASQVPLLDVTMQEIEDRTALGRLRPKKGKLPKAAAKGAPKVRLAKRVVAISLRLRRPSRTMKAALMLALVAAVAFGWSRISRRNQVRMEGRVKQTFGDAVDTAKGALRSLNPLDKPSLPESHPAPAPPDSHADDDDDSVDLPPTPPRDTPGAQLEAASHPRSAAPKKMPHMKDAWRLFGAGNLDGAIETLYQLRRQAPRSADIALLLGHVYFRKMWRTDALREYISATEWRPSLRHDRMLTRNAVAALDDPTYKLAHALIRTRLGTSALLDLRRAAHDSKNPKVQKRAERLLGQILHGARRKTRR